MTITFPFRAVYVGNLPEEDCEEELRTHFKQFGTIVEPSSFGPEFAMVFFESEFRRDKALAGTIDLTIKV